MSPWEAEVSGVSVFLVTPEGGSPGCVHSLKVASSGTKMLSNFCGLACAVPVNLGERRPHSY